MLMQARVHEPLDLHTDASDGGVGMCHVLFYAETFVHEGHAGAGVEVCDGVAELADFFAEGFVQGEEVGGWIGGRGCKWVV